MATGLTIVNGDFVINGSGQVDTVSQEDKCIRDFGKMIATDREFFGNETSYDRYNPNYGIELNNSSLFYGLSRLAVRDIVISILNQDIRDYLTMQENRNNLDLGEIITSVNLEAYYDVEDLRNIILEIRIKTAYSGQEISLGQFNQSVG